MKKTYFIPAMEIVKIETQQMIATSVGYNSTSVGAGDVDAPELPELPGVPPFVFE